LKIIMLPGTDGTGVLFKELIECLPNGFDIEVVCLNDLQGKSYANQTKEIAQRVGSRKLILVAESYSGRIAYELCGLLGNQIERLIFIASFITNPNPLTQIASLLPLWILKERFIPGQLLSYFCFSGYETEERIKLVRTALQSVSPKDIRQRLSNMAALTSPERRFDTDAIYIRPSKDRLVGESALRQIQKIYPNLEVCSVLGGHFVAQSNSRECAKIILSAATA
jgi:pimeloyl-ACP methyl ester carboxylesterase